MMTVSMSTPTVSLQGLTKYYGTFLGVENVTFDAHPGQVLGLLGPNGSGKTTILRMMLGLLKITRGSAQVFGLDVTKTSPLWRQRVGYLPGELSLYENLTVQEYLDYFQALRGGNYKARIVELCERLGLNPTKDIADLSKGTKQKVAVVQAFMHQPELLILDEPTSGLDPIIQHEFEEIIETERQRGTTIILSSHVMSEVERLADRVAIITKGHLAVTQSIAGLKERVTRSLEMEFPSPQDPQSFASLDGVTDVQIHRNTVICQVVGSENPLLERAVSLGVTSIRTHDPSLDDIFLDIVENHR